MSAAKQFESVRLLCDLDAMVSSCNGDWVERPIPAGTVIADLEFEAPDHETCIAGIACGEVTLDGEKFLVDFGGCPLDWWGEAPDGTGWFEVFDPFTPERRAAIEAYKAKWPRSGRRMQGRG